MGLQPILLVIHTITIATMLNFNDGNKRHTLKMLRVSRPLNIQCNLSFTVIILEDLLC